MALTVALVVVHPARDLPAAVLIATGLSQRGVTCHLVPSYRHELEISALAPDFVLLPSLRRMDQRAVGSLLDAGIAVGVLDTEGGVFPSVEQYASKVATDEAVRRRVACFCSWGPRLGAHVVGQGWYQKDQVVVTGSPRFDFYAEPWREAALKQSPAQACPKPLVLINSNFSAVNPLFSTADESFERWVVNKGYDREYVTALHAAQEEGLRGMVRLTNRLAASFPDVTFVYRPHPFERLSTYRDLLDQRGNLRLDKSGPVTGWILHASAVIQRGCTTAIEARMAGRPALSPTWIPTPALIPAVESVSTHCASGEELEAHIEAHLNGDGRPPAQDGLDHVIAEWFGRVDGAAHERVVTAILAHASEEGRATRLRGCREMHYGHHRRGLSLTSKVAARLRKHLGLPVTWSFRRWSNVADLQWWDASERHFDAAQARSMLDSILACQRGAGNTPGVDVDVASAHERSDYHWGYAFGRSVTVYAR